MSKLHPEVSYADFADNTPVLRYAHIPVLYDRASLQWLLASLPLVKRYAATTLSHPYSREEDDLWVPYVYLNFRRQASTCIEPIECSVEHFRNVTESEKLYVFAMLENDAVINREMHRAAKGRTIPVFATFNDDLPEIIQRDAIDPEAFLFSTEAVFEQQLSNLAGEAALRMRSSEEASVRNGSVGLPTVSKGTCPILPLLSCYDSYLRDALFRFRVEPQAQREVRSQIRRGHEIDGRPMSDLRTPQPVRRHLREERPRTDYDERTDVHHRDRRRAGAERAGDQHEQSEPRNKLHSHEAHEDVYEGGRGARRQTRSTDHRLLRRADAERGLLEDKLSVRSAPNGTASSRIQPEDEGPHRYPIRRSRPGSGSGSVVAARYLLNMHRLYCRWWERSNSSKPSPILR